jgi:hypothetical protein
MCVVTLDGRPGDPIEGLPVLNQIGAQRPHDVLLDPDFTNDRRLYIAYFTPWPGEPAAHPRSAAGTGGDVVHFRRRRADEDHEALAPPAPHVHRETLRCSN